MSTADKDTAELRRRAARAVAAQEAASLARAPLLRALSRWSAIASDALRYEYYLAQLAEEEAEASGEGTDKGLQAVLESHRIRLGVEGAHLTSQPVIVSIAERAKQWLARGLDELLSPLADFTVPQSGVPASSSSDIHFDDQSNGYELQLEWSSQQMAIKWVTPPTRTRPDLLVFETPDGEVLTIIALTDAPADSGSFARSDIGFDPTLVRWRVRLLRLSDED
jgi:hypothetical protein